MDSLLSLIRQTLNEDAAGRDITSRALLPPTLRIRARVIAKQPGVVAGTVAARTAFLAHDRRLRCVIQRRDGQPVRAGQAVLSVSGSARSIFAAERTALNLLGHLCGIATLTSRYARMARPSRVRILDTRKTLPGLRALQKEAVRAGGGMNHRHDLSDAVLIKTNHLQAMRRAQKGLGDAIEQAVHRARRVAHGKVVEVEVADLEQLRAALEARPDVILLDNFSLRDIRAAVQMVRAGRTHPQLEVSGGVTLATVRMIARTGVERVSIGRLTHSAPSLDVSLRVG